MNILMKAIILTLALTIPPTIHGTTQGSVVGRPVSQEQELKALDLSWHQAVADRNVAALSQLLADDYRLNVDAARILTKTQEIEAVKASDPLFDFGPFKLKDVSVKVEDGRAATVSGILTVRPNGGNKDSRRRYFYTRAFVRRDGRWQAITSRLVTLSTDVR